MSEPRVVKRKVAELTKLLVQNSETTIDAKEFKRLRASLGSFGQTETVLVVKLTDGTEFVQSGNKRVAAAEAEGIKELLCLEYEASADTAQAIRLTMNRKFSRFNHRARKRVEETSQVFPELAKELGLEEIPDDVGGSGKPEEEEKTIRSKGARLKVKLNTKKAARAMEAKLDAIAKKLGFEETPEGRGEALTEVMKSVKLSDFAKAE